MKVGCLFFMFANLIFSPIKSYGWGLGAQDYDECVLKKLEGVTSDLATKAIIASCKNKFPIKEKEGQPLDDATLSQITGTCRLNEDGWASLVIYNKTTDWTVTNIIVLISDQSTAHEAKGSFIADLFDHTYSLDTFVEPLTVTTESFETIDGQRTSSFSWKILSAKGYKQ